MRLSKLKELLPEVYNKLLLKCEWQTGHTLAFLTKENTEEIPEVIKQLLEMRKRDESKYKKLVVSIRLQLERRDVLANPNRVRVWRNDTAGNNQIYEFKSSAGLGFRIFFFLHNEDILVCTHAWVKDNEKSKEQQNQQFIRAERFRILFEERNRGTQS